MKVALTGIKPTGIPHIGNFLGAIQPSIRLSETCEARYFIADYHALNSTKDPEEIRKMSIEVAAAWLACGLDPEKVLFYKQSGVPETFELLTILLAFTPKGLMNRAHAYKAMLQSNNEAGKDPDDGVNMGLYTYPVLMAADILLFDTDFVPVGNDQFQHVEMAVDIAQSFNFVYGTEAFKLPQPMAHETGKTVLGLDGRKMSKSYGNCIFISEPEESIKDKISKMMTDPQRIRRNDPGDPEVCPVFAYHKLYSSPGQVADVAHGCRTAGIGCVECKQILMHNVLSRLGPIHERRLKLERETDRVREVVLTGNAAARKEAALTMAEVRKAVGMS